MNREKKVLKKRILHLKCLDAFYHQEKELLRNLTGTFSKHTIVALSNGKR